MVVVAAVVDLKQRILIPTCSFAACTRLYFVGLISGLIPSWIGLPHVGPRVLFPAELYILSLNLISAQFLAFLLKSSLVHDFCSILV